MSTENILLAHSGVGNQYEVYEAADASHDQVTLFTQQGSLLLHFSDVQPSLTDVLLPIGNIASGHAVSISKANSKVWVILAPTQQVHVVRGEARIGGV